MSEFSTVIIFIIISAILGIVLRILDVFEIFSLFRQRTKKDDRPFILDNIDRVEKADELKPAPIVSDFNEKFVDKDDDITINEQEDEESDETECFENDVAQVNDKPVDQINEKPMNQINEKTVGRKKKMLIVFIISFVILVCLGLLIFYFLFVKAPQNIIGKKITLDEGTYIVVNDLWIYDDTNNVFRTYDYIKNDTKKDSLIKIDNTVSMNQVYKLDEIKYEKISDDEINNVKNKLSNCPSSLKGYQVSFGDEVFKVFSNTWLSYDNGYYCTYEYNGKKNIRDGKFKVYEKGDYSLFDANLTPLSEWEINSLQHGLDVSFARDEILEAEKKAYMGKSETFRELSFNNKNRMNGNDVAILQSSLYSLGYTDVGEIDGWYGPKTDKAFKQFQKDYGLEENGIFDEKCFNVMISTLYAKDIETGSTDSYLKSKESQKEEWFNNAEILLSKEFFGKTKRIKDLFSNLGSKVKVITEISDTEATIQVELKDSWFILGSLCCKFSYSNLSPAGTCYLRYIKFELMGVYESASVYPDIKNDSYGARQCLNLLYNALQKIYIYF